MWPFHRRIPSSVKLHYGDEVFYRNGWGAKLGVVISASDNGKLVSVATWRDFNAYKARAAFDPDALCDVVLLPRRKIIDFELRGEKPKKVEKSDPPPLLDARVLTEVKALESAVGGTESLLDLLRSIRAGYGEKVG